MLYETPDLRPHRDVLEELEALRRRLGAEVARAVPWVGRLRRAARITAARSSTAIEGYHVSLREAAAVVEGDAGAVGRNQRALAGYALAMQHVAVLADDPGFLWSQRVLLDLHFEACHGDPASRPGRWRAGDVHVTAPGGGVAYRAPAVDEVAGLVAELVAWLGEPDPDIPVVVQAAMAHLHLVSIHPFRDGNGRLSRIVQSLVLARDGVLAPELGSIEEILARDTSIYYAALGEVQGGSWEPGRSATPWLSFCLAAHQALGRERLAVIEAAARRWGALEALVEERGWPDRLAIALEQSLFDGVTRASYAAEADVSPATASADLRRLVDAGLVDRRGRGRNIHHVATEALRTRVPSTI